MKRWSKIQKELYNIVDPKINFQIQCSIYKTNSSWVTKDGKGRETVPRFWITIDKKVVWDYPQMFLDCKWRSQKLDREDYTIRDTYYYNENYTWVSNVIRQYLNTPREQLASFSTKLDDFGLVDILRSVDRRIGWKSRERFR